MGSYATSTGFLYRIFFFFTNARVEISFKDKNKIKYGWPGCCLLPQQHPVQIMWVVSCT